MVKLGSKSSRKKLKNRGYSNRAQIRKHLRELDPNPVDTNFWIYLAGRQDGDGTFHLKRYGSALDALRDIQGVHVFASRDRDGFFEYIRTERFKVDRPAVFTGTTFIVDFPQESLARQYEQYGETVEPMEDHHASP